MVEVVAWTIENRLLRRLPYGVCVSFGSRPDLIGSGMEALAVFDPAGRVIGLNGRARSLLPASGDRLATYADLFRDPPFSRLFDAGGATLSLHAHAGLRLAASVALPTPPSRPQRRPTATAGKPHGPDDAALDLLRVTLRDPATALAFASAQRALQRRLPVLLMGETGTGKELFARGLYASCFAARGHFVPLNCAAIPEALIEAELFGYADGAFTGARKAGSAGKLEMANEGVLFLDEIGDMPLHFQVKLLRVLEDQCVIRLGETQARLIRFDLICATHRRLPEMVAAGTFREDLYYRINAAEVCLPPLRERTNVLELAEHFLRCQSQAEPPPPLSESARQLVAAHRWPGNLRQLRYALAAATGGRTITDEDFPAAVRSGGAGAAAPQNATRGRPEKVSLELAIDRAIEEALSACGGNVSQAARLLAVSRTTIYSRRKRPFPTAEGA
jgi:transcriptional regulator of acetoin/glycerol metabolism